MYTYYISVGSNMGDKRGYISSAFQSLLHHEAISRLVTSPLIETEPWGYTEQDTFVNGVWFDRGEIPRVDRRWNAYPFYRTPHCKP